MFSKKFTKIEKNLHHRFDNYLVSVKSTVKIWSIFVVFLENTNFSTQCHNKKEVETDKYEFCFDIEIYLNR